MRRRREASTAKRYAEEWGDRKGGKEAGVRRKWYAKVRGGCEKELGGEVEV